MVAIGTLQIGSVAAHGSHVEYVVPDQPGIVVETHGNGLVEAEVTTCLTADSSVSFDILISSDREGDTDLTVRKQGNPDIKSWFSLSPTKVDLPSDGTPVKVTISPPEDEGLPHPVSVRVQEIGDGPSPGGHHGVKIQVNCVAALIPPEVEPPTEPSPTPKPVPGSVPTSMPTPTPKPAPGSVPTSVPTPTPKPAPGSVPTSVPTPTLEPTPTPEQPKGFPDTGDEPPEKSSPWGYVLLGSAALMVTGGYLAWRHRRGIL